MIQVAGQVENVVPLLLGNFGDAQATLPEEHHVLERAGRTAVASVLLELRKAGMFRVVELLTENDGDTHPPRVGLIRLLIVVGVLLVERRFIDSSFSCDLKDSHNSRNLTTGVIKESKIALLHRHHMVLCSMVAD